MFLYMIEWHCHPVSLLLNFMSLVFEGLLHFNFRTLKCKQNDWYFVDDDYNAYYVFVCKRICIWWLIFQFRIDETQSWCISELQIQDRDKHSWIMIGLLLYHGIPTLLTHWGRDKMDAISQTTRSSAFSWMKMFEFRLRFHWSLFLRVQLTITQHCFR